MRVQMSARSDDKCVLWRLANTVATASVQPPNGNQLCYDRDDGRRTRTRAGVPDPDPRIQSLATNHETQSDYSNEAYIAFDQHWL